MKELLKRWQQKSARRLTLKAEESIRPKRHSHVDKIRIQRWYDKVVREQRPSNTLESYSVIHFGFLLHWVNPVFFSGISLLFF